MSSGVSFLPASAILVCLLPGFAHALGACGGDDTTCGPGTVLSGETCIAVAPATVGQGGSGAGGGGTGGQGGGQGGGQVAPIPVFGGATSASPSSPSSLLVTWDAASDDATPPEAIRYEVFVADASGGQDFSAPVATTVGVTSLQVGGLTEAEHFVVVRAVDTDGNADANTTEVSATPTTDTTPPTFAGITSAGRASSSDVQLQWDAATDDLTAQEGITYAIFRTAVGGNFAFGAPLTLSPPGVTTLVVPVPDDQEYDFAVRAIDAAGNRDANTARTTASAEPDTVGPTFAGCTGAAVISAGSAYVTWAPGSDDVTAPSALTYNVYASEAPGGQDFSTPTSSFTGGAGGEVTGLDAATTYYFACRAADAAGNLSADNAVQVSGTTLPDSEPPTFAGVTSISNPTTMTLDVSWSTPASDNGTPTNQIVYDAYAATTTGAQTFSTPTASSQPGASSVTLTGLDPGTVYFVVVRARDAAGNQDTNTVEQSLRTLVAFSQVQAIFTGACAVTGCHAGGTAPFGLRLDSEFFSYQAICGGGTTCTVQAAGEHLTQNLIQPGSPTTSWLYRKMTNTHATNTAECGGGFCGDPMPPPGCGLCTPVTTADEELIADWISQGADQL